MDSNLKPGDEVFIKARVLRLRGGLVETQLGDGQMVRTPADNVTPQPSAPAPDSKAVKGAPENKAVRRGENKGGRK